MNGLRPGLLIRLGGSLLAAGLLVALFLLGRKAEPVTENAADAPGARKASIALLDRQIDSVLALFGVPSSSVNKRAFEIPEEDFARTERLVPLPDTVAVVMVNDAMNDMARRCGGRAAATENPRLGTVTIHIELAGTVVHTVILKKVRVVQPADGRQPRPAT